jgi:hypothetical protein
LLNDTLNASLAEIAARLVIPAFAIYEGAAHRTDRDPGAMRGFGDGKPSARRLGCSCRISS